MKPMNKTNLCVVKDLLPTNSRPINSKLANITPNASADLMAYARTKEGCLHLSQGQGTRSTPDFICSALNESLQRGETYYSQSLGTPELRNELSSYYQRIFNLDIKSQRISVTPSGSNAMHVALTSIIEEGDELVAITPIWKNLLGAVELEGGKIVQVPLEENEKQGWFLDLEKLFSAVTEKTKALLITTPSNPTGWTMEEDQIKQVVSFARERGIWIISDEVYARCMYERTHAPSFLEHTNEEDLLLTINSFSKSWAMTGWRLGWIVGPTWMEQHIQNVTMYENLCMPVFTQSGAIAALKQGEDFLKEQMSLWQSNRDLLMKRLGNRKDVRLHLPKSTFYGFFKILETDESDITQCRRMINEVGVSLAPGSSFGKGGNGYIRINFAVDQQTFTEALDRIKTFL